MQGGVAYSAQGMGDERDGPADDDTTSDADDLDRIVEAAWQVLEANGYENLKIQAVIRLAGVSTGRFYRHFEGKDELVAAIVRQENRRATAILEEQTRHGTPAERVLRWVDLVVSLAFGRRTGPRARFFTSQPPEVRALLGLTADDDANPAAPLFAAIADGRRAGDFPESDAETDGRLVFLLCSRIDEIGGDLLGDDRQRTVDAVGHFVLAALTSERPRPPADPAP